MKKAKLSLKRVTIANLSNNEKRAIIGGIRPTILRTICDCDLDVTMYTCKICEKTDYCTTETDC